jgi:hypothetical protein
MCGGVLRPVLSTTQRLPCLSVSVLAERWCWRSAWEPCREWAVAAGAPAKDPPRPRPKIRRVRGKHEHNTHDPSFAHKTVWLFGSHSCPVVSEGPPHESPRFRGPATQVCEAHDPSRMTQVETPASCFGETLGSCFARALRHDIARDLRQDFMARKTCGKSSPRAVRADVGPVPMCGVSKRGAG